MPVCKTKKEDSKVVIIGLDGATFDLIIPWVKDGKLPNFAKLLGESSFGTLSTTIPPMSPTAWVSFQTGVNPGKHGVFHFYEVRLDRPLTPISSSSIGARPFWEFINRSEGKVGIVNVFGTFPPKETNGFIIAGRTVPRGRVFTYPADLEKEIQDNVGKYVIDIDPYHAQPQARNLSRDAFLKLLHQMLEVRINTYWYLMEKYDPTLFLIVFTATDMVQHFFYQYLDEKHPQYKPSESKKYQNAIFDIYAKIDQFLGEINKNMGANDTLIIVSDHGAGPWYKELNLNRWLFEQHLLIPRATTNPLISTTGKLMQQILPIGLFSYLERRYRKMSKKEEKGVYWNLPVDWGRTKAFAHGHYGNIYINLKGREPGGIVEAGKEYENVCSYIERMLLEWRNPDTGRPVIKRVYRKQDLYSGRETIYAPDLVVEWEDYRYLASHPGDARSNIIDSVHSFYKNVPQTGSHRQEGILIAKGPNIKKNYPISYAHITDVAPTVLYLFGCKVPSYMDGKVLTEIFEEPYVSSHPVVIDELELERVVTEEAGAFQEDEAEEIKRRLRALGYMD